MRDLPRGSIRDAVKDTPIVYERIDNSSQFVKYGSLFLAGTCVGYVLGELTSPKEIENNFIHAFNWGVVPLGIVGVARVGKEDWFEGLALGAGYLVGRLGSVFS